MCNGDGNLPEKTTSFWTDHSEGHILLGMDTGILMFQTNHLWLWAQMLLFWTQILLSWIWNGSLCNGHRSLSHEFFGYIDLGPLLQGGMCKDCNKGKVQKKKKLKKK